MGKLPRYGKGVEMTPDQIKDIAIMIVIIAIFLTGVAILS